MKSKDCNESVMAGLGAAPGKVPFSELQKAYNEGKRASKKGLIENPYPIPVQRGTRSFSPRDSWKRGWLAGKAHNDKLRHGEKEAHE